MATGRKYVIRRRLRTNYFLPKAYKNACSNIVNVRQKSGNPYVIVVVCERGETSINALLKEVLTYNDLAPFSTLIRGKKYIDFQYKTKKKAEDALSLLSKMRNDRVDDSSVNFKVNPPTAKTVQGIDVELEGYTQQQQGNEPDSAYTDNSKPTETQNEQNGKTVFGLSSWLLVGGIAVAAALAIVLILKKK